MRSSLVRALGVFLLAVSATSCSGAGTDATTGSGTPSSTTAISSRTPTTTSAVPLPLIRPLYPVSWVMIRDVPTGFAVSLPRQVTPDESAKEPPQRVYAVRLSMKAVADVTVAFMEMVIKPRELEAIVRAKADTLKEGGATDIAITDVTPAMHAGKFAAYDFTTTYTRQGVKSVMWSRYIAGPKSFVVVATEATGEATAPEPLAKMREYHQRTVDSVVAI